ncbi:MAG: extracellular solute-binding protein [Thainema sp.]
MVNRRSVLIGGSALAAAQLLSACRPRQIPRLRVDYLKDSVPSSLLEIFQESQAEPLDLRLQTSDQIRELYEMLVAIADPQNAPKPWLRLPFRNSGPPQLDIVTLGDYWLTKAIREELIQPLNVSQLSGWSQLPPQFQQLVQRNEQGSVEPNGSIWGAPYRWGSTVIIYRIQDFDDLGWTPQDWSDLWRPELRGKISLLDSPREVIGLTLKRLGYSYNEPDLAAIAELPKALAELDQQVKVYTSTSYLEPLLIGDISLAVGWSTDIVPVLRKSRDLAAVVPVSGTALFADLWVQPASASSTDDADSSTDLLSQWFNFYWQPEVGIQLALQAAGSSPVVPGLSADQLPETLQQDELSLPNSEILSKSEFLLPLTDDTAKKQFDLWEEMRCQEKQTTC